jgi:sialate O-acetylesterase
VCCAGLGVCNTTDTAWVSTAASRIDGTSLKLSLAVLESCASKRIDGLRYLWRETPCPFKQAAVYNSEDSNLSAPPYIYYFSK